MRFLNMPFAARWGVLALAAVGVGSGLTVAQPPDFAPPSGTPQETSPAGGPPAMGPFGGGPPGGRFPSPPLLEALDANHDGELDAMELAAAAARLATLDKNHDGQLGEDELRPSFGLRRGGPGGPPGGPGGPPGGSRNARPSLMLRFDANQDGMLDKYERAQARDYIKANGPGRSMPRGGPGGPPGPGGLGGLRQAVDVKPGRTLSPAAVPSYPHAGLYDAHVLRTLFFVFENQDWEQELEDFHGTDVEVPAQLTVDGRTYPNVGVRFRGMSSYRSAPRGKKRSLNVTLDLVDRRQRLLGYKSLNLLNSSEDPSFLHTVLFDRVARHYLPAPQANLVRVVINGECWGIYVNEEPFNKDFIKRWFGESDGPRWKVPANFSGAAALMYHGDQVDTYRGLYEIKSPDADKAWRDLIALCRLLAETPDAELERKLGRVLDLDRALWFLALDSVFLDQDGYFSRGSDYSIYQDVAHGRFHLLPRDSNETFHVGGGPGGLGGPGGPPGGLGFFAGSGGMPSAMLGGDEMPGGMPGFFGGPGGMPGGPGGPGGGGIDPLGQVQNKMRPLIQRLLSSTNLRARYLAHVRTIAHEWLDWKVLGPMFEDYRTLIAEDVLADTRNLSTFAKFFDSDIGVATGGGPFGGSAGLKRFIEERRKYLDEYPELAKPRPAIVSVERTAKLAVDRPVEVIARLGVEPPAQAVLLYYAFGREAPFQCVPMERQPDQLQRYTAAIPAAAAGTEVLYYVEARAPAALGTCVFHPSGAEMGALRYRLDAPTLHGRPPRKLALAINEVMAANMRTMRSPTGKYSDWLEIANFGTQDLDLSGLHLSDDPAQPTKWTFPAGTRLRAGDYLVVWADELPLNVGLHANFRLSKQGESLLLSDSDAEGATLVDRVDFGPQQVDVSYGRYPNARGRWQAMQPTPGKPNSDR
jgi:spore coat protein CotH